MTKKFTLYELLLIAGLSAIGLAIKPIINPFIHLISSGLRIPGGSLTGGFLMIWPAFTRIYIDKPGSALIFGLTQGMVVIMLGFFGSHGIFSLVTYTMPCLVIEILALLLGIPNFFCSLPAVRREPRGKMETKRKSLLVICTYCVGANVTGSLLVALMIMQLPLIMLSITTISAIISGLMGGYCGWLVMEKLAKYRVF